MTRPRLGPSLGVALGVPVLLFGVWGMFHDADRTHPADAFRWIVGSAAVHDFVVLPLVLGIGWLLTRPFPTWTRPALRLGVAVSAVLAIVAWPLIAGYGEDRTIPSLLPRNEAAGLVAYLGLVWVAVALWLAFRAWRQGNEAPRQAG
jgi:hypothetical protein